MRPQLSPAARTPPRLAVPPPARRALAACTPTGATFRTYAGSICAGTPYASSSTSYPGTCAVSSPFDGSYTRTTCQAGTLAQASVYFDAAYTSPATCPIDDASYSPSLTSYTATNACVNINNQSVKITCQSASAAVAVTYSAPNCQGTSVAAARGGFGCTAFPSSRGGGAEVVSCIGPFSGARAGAGAAGAAAAAAAAALLALVARA